MTRFVAAIAVLLGVAASCNENAAHEQMAEARRLSALLGTQFTKATGAANRAVMSDTDEASASFADEARAATDAVQVSAAALRPILSTLGYSDETRLLDEFEQRFAEYRALDSNILALVAEGTNLKAKRLSFGAAHEAADALRDALERVVPAQSADTWRVKALAATALASAREIQVLQAPHIAEPDDAEMTRLEARMAAAETTARGALANLGRLVSTSSRSEVATATASLDRLSSLNSEISTLSRRNSNVRALALSLGQKRVLADACGDALRALQEVVEKRGLPTR